MTQLGKIIITAGIVIFTASALMWIAKNNWQYFAGGAAIFVGCILSGIVLSIETKSSNNGSPSNRGIPYRPTSDQFYHIPADQRIEQPTKRQSLGDTDPYPTAPISGNWTPPNSPPPDQEQKTL